MEPVHSVRKEEKVVAERREASKDAWRYKSERKGEYIKKRKEIDQGRVRMNALYIKSRKNRPK